MIKITLTYAQSIDGRIATAGGHSRYISKSASLKLNQELRKDHDAILVGIGTVLRDDPLLTCRISDKESPVRVVLDSRLRLPLSSQIARTAERYPTLVVCSLKTLDQNNPAAVQIIDKLEKSGVELVPVPATPDGRLHLREIILELEKRNISSVMVEGGSSILTSFLSEKLWTSMVVVAAPLFIGAGVPAFADLGIATLEDAVTPLVEKIDIIGEEVVWHLKPGEPLKTGAEKTETESLFFTAPGKVELRRHTISPSHANDMLFRSRLMAISPGTERHFFNGTFERGECADPEIDCMEGRFDYPFTYGYINILEHEDGRRFFGLREHTGALFAREEDLLPIPDGMPDERALLIAHTETALGIVHDSGVSAGDLVLVVGAGVVGTLCAFIMRFLMGCEVTVMDTCSDKQTWFTPDQFPDIPALHRIEFFSSEQDLTEYDVSIDTSGSGDGLQTAIDHTCFEGTITAASWFGAAAVQLRLGENFHKKRLVMKSSQVSHIDRAKGSLWTKQRRFDEIIKVLQYIQPDFLITHRFLFSQGQKAFSLISNENSMHGLIALVP
jgi:riboflavin-specific deaminase-like protein